LLVGFLALWLVYELAGSALGWTSRHQAAALLVFVAGFGVAGGVTLVALRARNDAQRRREEWEHAERVRKLELRRRGGWWDSLTPSQFESEVAALVRRDGGTARARGGAGDGGIDIEGTAPDGRRLVVQCKRYQASRSVNAHEVRDLIGAAKLRRAEVVLLVTTSARISTQAADHARREGVGVVPRDRLLAWGRGAPLRELPRPAPPAPTPDPSDPDLVEREPPMGLPDADPLGPY
jgi:restriction system protein